MQRVLRGLVQEDICELALDQSLQLPTGESGHVCRPDSPPCVCLHVAKVSLNFATAA
jgi:hypothetical protein